MSELTAIFYLNRSSRYANPLSSNDRLPIVYGDLTDGTNGIWKLPCIDTVNFVYCFADHIVLTVAGGNTINIYADGVLISPASYTFSASNNYEAKGNISTVTFTTDRANAVITARGKGKVITGTTLMDNIIDIVNDFLVVENTFTSTLYESTAKSRAAQVFTAQTYKAAGVIYQDVAIWETLVDMLGSFLGSVYLNGSKKLVMMIDTGVVEPYIGIISHSDIIINDIKVRLLNIINQCPANYRYNYESGEFKAHTDDSSLADISSQGVFGVRKPNTPYQFYWCRDIVTVQKIQDIIVAKLKNPLYEVELTDTSLTRLNVDIGETLIASIDSLYDSDGIVLQNNYWKVLTVTPDYAKNNIKFMLLQTAVFMMIAYTLDGTYKLDGSIKLGNNRDLTVY